MCSVDVFTKVAPRTHSKRARTTLSIFSREYGSGYKRTREIENGMTPTNMEEWTGQTNNPVDIMKSPIAREMRPSRGKPSRHTTVVGTSHHPTFVFIGSREVLTKGW
jgi:hypothetical protein